jgi:outer membrane protein OmpA-like peptidoglycan-associated protein
MFKLTAIKALPLTLVLLAGCTSGTPADPVSAQTPGFVALQKGDNATAEKDLRADNANTPHSAYDELDLGLVYQRKGRMDMAEPLYRQAMTDGHNVHPTVTTTQWSKDMTVEQIACENLSLGLPPAAPGTESPCQTTVVVAVVTPDTTASTSHTVAYNTYFDFDKSTLTDAGQTQIASAAKEQAENPNRRITVLGKASNVGTDEYNMALSHRRADTVRAAMIADGVPASKIDVSWVGDREPVVAEAAGTDEPLNRLVQSKVQ